MSYTVDLIVGKLPDNDKDAWARIEALRESYYGDKRDRASVLTELHAALTLRFPCLSSYSDNDPAMESCPWADGPMLGNFAHDMGMLAISYSRVDEVVPFVVKEANALGITVADGQSGEIHRPSPSGGREAGSKPWWKFW